MEQVKLGLMLPGAKVFGDDNVNPTWKAHVKTHESIVVAYVKQISLQKLYIECVCAVIGRELGLPIPKPILIQITHQVFEEIPKDKIILAFGSEDAGYPSFRRYAKSNEALEKLKSYPKALEIGVFDEWIANCDRNIGNILYDGGENFSFIDHERAIDLSLKESESADNNQIINFLYSETNEFEKYKVNNKVDINITPSYKSFPFLNVIEKTYANSYLPYEYASKVIKFLENRTMHIKELLSKRLGIKQREMVL